MNPKHAEIKQRFMLQDNNETTGILVLPKRAPHLFDASGLFAGRSGRNKTARTSPSLSAGRVACLLIVIVLFASTGCHSRSQPLGGSSHQIEEVRWDSGNADTIVWVADGLFLLGWLGAIRTIVGRPAELDRRGNLVLPVSGTHYDFPRRPHCLLAAVACLLIVIYCSLVPLTPISLTFLEASKRFGNTPYLALSVHQRADWVANILAAIPASFFSMAVLNLDIRSWTLRLWSLLNVFIASASLGIAIEFTQIWFPPRTVSQNDIIAYWFGSLMGTLLWLFLGQCWVNWVRSFSHATGLRDRLCWLLEAYMAGLLLYSALPLDLVSSPVELEQKLHAHRIRLVPFESWDMTSEGLFPIFVGFLAFLIVGIWATLCRTEGNVRVRSVLESCLLGGIMAVIIEIGQVLVYSRFAAMQDVLIEIFAVAVGSWGTHWLVSQKSLRSWTAATRVRAATLLSVVSVVYALGLAVLFCSPYQRLSDAELIQQRFDGFWAVPFAALYHGSEFNAATEILHKLVLFGPLASIMTVAVSLCRLSRSMERMVLSVIFLGLVSVTIGIELLQVYFPPRIPDVTDSIIASAGAAVGMFVTRRVLCASFSPQEAACVIEHPNETIDHD